jgi:NAD(P)H-dependent FMN reductase
MGHPRDIRILAISGSLRAKSLNTRVLRFASRVALPGTGLHLCDVLDRLPHFNPDLDTDSGPAAVVSFRAQLNAAAAVVISSPEYAYGVPGTLKNALDWVVRSGELVGKPVGLWNLSARAMHAHASLVETLQTMSALVLAEACFTWAKAPTTDIEADPELPLLIEGSFAALTEASSSR